MEYGVLRDKNDVKLLILYILKIAKQAVLLPDLTDIIMSGGNANYFDFSEALNQLLSIDHITVKQTDKGELYTITPIGCETIEMFEKKLPYSVREKSMRIVAQTLTKIKAESELSCTIEHQTFGFLVTCGIKDMDELLFQISVSVGNRMQAELIIKQFRENPEYIYKHSIALLTTEIESEE